MEYTWVLIVSTNLFCNEMSLPKKKRLEQASNQTTCVWGNMYYIMCQYLVTNMRVESEWT